MQNPITYPIRIKEALGTRWAEWFEPLAIQAAPDGDTLLVGPLRDQAELHDVLLKVRNLNLTLLSVTPAESISLSE